MEFKLFRKTMAAALAFAVASLPIAAQAKAAPDPAGRSPVITGAYKSPRAGSHPGRAGPLTPDEQKKAAIAWRYFVNNTQPSTGLVNAADGFPSTTIWDSGSAIAAIVSAAELGIIPRAEGLARLDKLITTVGALPLVRGKHPNKAYNTLTGQASNYSNQPGEIGTSAIDIARMLIWLKLAGQRFPEVAAKANAIPARWHLAELVRDGYLYGTAIGPNGSIQHLQEGRLGYEEYAAKGFALWGFNAKLARRPQPYGLIKLYGVSLPFDGRDPRELGAHNYVVTESYALDGFEFGWDEPEDKTSDAFTHTSGWIARSAQNMYLAQQRRFEKTRIFTARTEHQLLGPPYFVYDTLFSDGQPWVTITEDGKSVPESAAVALKGAFGLWALWKTPYTDQLMLYVRNSFDPDKGWYEGVFENGNGSIKQFTANNNGIILETLLYKRDGKLLR
jgi:hypothetical protein